MMQADIAMWTVEHRITAPVGRSELWRAWTDIEGWPQWDPRSQWARLNGPFKSGQTGRAKFKGSPASDYRITSVEPERMFGLEVRSPFVTALYEHELGDAGSGETDVCERVTVGGLLGPLLALRVRARMRDYLPGKLRRLAEHAASSHPSNLG